MSYTSFPSLGNSDQRARPAREHCSGRGLDRMRSSLVLWQLEHSEAVQSLFGEQLPATLHHLPRTFVACPRCLVVVSEPRLCQCSQELDVFSSEEVHRRLFRYPYSGHSLDSVRCSSGPTGWLCPMEKSSLQSWWSACVFPAKYLSLEDRCSVWRSQSSSHLCWLSQILPVVGRSVRRGQEELKIIKYCPFYVGWHSFILLDQFEINIYIYVLSKLALFFVLLLHKIPYVGYRPV